jgi:hypothetical protein
MEASRNSRAKKFQTFITNLVEGIADNNLVSL